MTRRIPLPNDSISMSSTMADALIQKSSGDAALLLLYLLRHDGFYNPDEAGKTLGWPRDRLDSTMLLLSELGVDTGEPVPEFQEAAPSPADAPSYTREELTQALSEKSEFPILYEEVKRLYHAPQLSDRDTQTLLNLYDNLGMPTDALIHLITHVVSAYQRKNHSNAVLPPMAYISKNAYRLKRKGFDTFEAVDSYFKRQEYFESREGELLAAVGIVGRSAYEGEQRFIEQWMDWGFPAETVAIAHEKTILNNGKMVWNYCNAILRNWHSKGLHSPEEVRLHDSNQRPAKGNVSRAPAPAAPVSTAQQAQWDKALEENQRQLEQLLKNAGGNS